MNAYVRWCAMVYGVVRAQTHVSRQIKTSQESPETKPHTQSLSASLNALSNL